MNTNERENILNVTSVTQANETGKKGRSIAKRVSAGLLAAVIMVTTASCSKRKETPEVMPPAQIEQTVPTATPEVPVVQEGFYDVNDPAQVEAQAQKILTALENSGEEFDESVVNLTSISNLVYLANIDEVKDKSLIMPMSENAMTLGMLYGSYTMTAGNRLSGVSGVDKKGTYNLRISDFFTVNSPNREFLVKFDDNINMLLDGEGNKKEIGNALLGMLFDEAIFSDPLSAQDEKNNSLLYFYGVANTFVVNILDGIGATHTYTVNGETYTTIPQDMSTYINSTDSFVNVMGRALATRIDNTKGYAPNC